MSAGCRKNPKPRLTRTMSTRCTFQRAGPRRCAVPSSYFTGPASDPHHPLRQLVSTGWRQKVSGSAAGQWYATASRCNSPGLPMVMQGPRRGPEGRTTWLRGHNGARRRSSFVLALGAPPTTFAASWPVQQQYRAQGLTSASCNCHKMSAAQPDSGPVSA